MDEEKVRYFIEAERRKGTSTEELIFILYDNGVPVYEMMTNPSADSFLYNNLWEVHALFIII